MRLIFTLGLLFLFSSANAFEEDKNSKNQALSEKLLNLERILESYVVSNTEFNLKSEDRLTYKEILEQEIYYLEELERFENFLKIYEVVESFNDAFYKLKTLQDDLRANFSKGDEFIFEINKIQRKIEDLKKQFFELKRRRGNLSSKELREFIMFSYERLKDKDVLSDTPPLKEALDKTLNYIKAFYKDIDQEVEKLEAAGYSLSSIICNSSFHISDKQDCLPIFYFNDKEKVRDFLDSLSPSRWQSFYKEFQTTSNLKAQKKIIDKEKVAENLIWFFNQNQFVYRNLSSFWKASDFYRWLYFILKEKLQESPKDFFSWNFVFDILKKQDEILKTLQDEMIHLSIEKEKLKKQNTFYLEKIKAQELNYFNLLNSIKEKFSLLNVRLEEKDLFCLAENLHTFSNITDCINLYISFSSLEEWKEHLTETLNQFVFSSVFIRDSLKKR
ncbi:MAG: hypothetical protein GDA46_04110 [Bdellovibrionales bacterium]|nr:hypothetical protein [Bdellovibrionales bacterium]